MQLPSRRTAGSLRTKMQSHFMVLLFTTRGWEAMERHAMGKLTMKKMVVRTIIRVMKHRAQIKNRTPRPKTERPDSKQKRPDSKQKRPEPKQKRADPEQKQCFQNG